MERAFRNMNTGSESNSASELSESSSAESSNLEIVKELRKFFEDQSPCSSVSGSYTEIEKRKKEKLSHEISSLCSRINDKLKYVNQKMAVLLDNVETLNSKNEKLRALVREVILEEKLSGK